MKRSFTNKVLCGIKRNERPRRAIKSTGVSILTAVSGALVLGRASIGRGLAGTFSAVTEAEVLRRLPHVEKEEITKKYGASLAVQLLRESVGDTLTSYPYNVTIPIADVCNARCAFVRLGWKAPRVRTVGDV